MSLPDYPFVSVVVPVYNASAYIDKLLKALGEQSYPQDCYEVIIVDNNSTDDTFKLISSSSFKAIQENDIQSSYAARNKGIAEAKGGIIAFTDADCTPCKEWIAQGVFKMRAEQADLVAGNVEFVYSPKPTAAEIYDSITHMQVESEVVLKGVAPTANLFVKRRVFDCIGFFDAKVKSGGDIQFTKKATVHGCKLCYSDTAVVYHPTRSYFEFVRKIIRTGKGSAHYRLSAGHSLIHEFFYMPYAVFFKISTEKALLKSRFEQRQLSSYKISFNRVVAFGVFCSFVSHLAAMLEFWRILILIALGRYKSR